MSIFESWKQRNKDRAIEEYNGALRAREGLDSAMGVAKSAEAARDIAEASYEPKRISEEARKRFLEEVAENKQKRSEERAVLEAKIAEVQARLNARKSTSES